MVAYTPSSNAIFTTPTGPDINERQAAILQAIWDSYRPEPLGRERPPSLDELMDDLGLTRSTVWYNARKLERKGYIKTTGTGRHIVLVRQAGAPCPYCQHVDHAG